MEPVSRVVRHFQEELEQLKTRLLEMGGAAEEQVRLAVKGLAERDHDSIDQALVGDAPINALHIEIDNRCFTLLAHPTGRLLGEREACAIDLPKVLRRARQRGCFVELNGQPQRLDLNDTACQMAKTEGVMVAINSDAHSGFDFDHLQLGIGQARRGWLERDDVLNTRSLADLRPLLARTMG